MHFCPDELNALAQLIPLLHRTTAWYCGYLAAVLRSGCPRTTSKELVQVNNKFPRRHR